MIPHKAEALRAIEQAQAMLRRIAPLTDLDHRIILATLDHAREHCEQIIEVKRVRKAAAVPQTTGAEPEEPAP